MANAIAVVCRAAYGDDANAQKKKEEKEKLHLLGYPTDAVTKKGNDSISTTARHSPARTHRLALTAK